MGFVNNIKIKRDIIYYDFKDNIKIIKMQDGNIMHNNENYDIIKILK